MNAPDVLLTDWRPGRALLLRFVAYVAIVAGALFVYLSAIERAVRGPEGLDAMRALLAEDRFMETLQISLLILGLLIAAAPIPRPRRLIDVLLALLLAAALARECDDQLGRWLFNKSHRVFMTGFAVAAGALIYARRRVLVQEVATFVHRPGFALLVFGALVAGSFAQALGATDLWKPLIPDNDQSRMAKRYVEEGLEFTAYLLILLGTIEERWFRTRLGSNAVPPVLTSSGENSPG